MRRAMTSPKRVFLFSIAILTALALGAPSGALAETGLGISSTVSEPGGALVAQMRGWRRPFGSLAKVPNVTGKPQKIAEQMLNGAGFNSVVKPVRTRDPAQEGKVKTQRPPAGQMHPRVMPVALEVWELEKVRGRPGGLTAEGESVQVPDVKGKPQTEAERLLEGKGLRHQVAMRIPTPDRTQAGKVASQSPEAGKTVAKGTKVLLFIPRYMAPPGGGGPPPGWHPPGLGGGSRPSMVNTPHVIGMPQAEAVRLLKGRGLDPQVAMRVPTPDRQQVGKVASQSPEAGTTVPRGTKVALNVLRYMAPPGGGGPPPGWHPPGLGGGGRPSRVNTPGVIGMTKAEAERKLRDAGLGSRVRDLYATTDKSRDGRVKFHQPPPGMPVLPGTTVALDVWNLGGGRIEIIGSPVTTTTVLVPFVVRMTKAEAEKALRDRGFGSRVKGMAATDIESFDGKVSSQEPGGGRWAGSGTTVSLDIYKTAPRVVGLGWSAAVARLRSAGYTAHVKRWSPVGQDSSKRGMVTRQYAAKTGPGPPGSGLGPGWLGRIVAPPPPNPLVGNVGLDVYKYAIVVPDVIRMKLGDAKKKLKEAGYKVGGSTWVYVKDQSKHCKVQKTYPSAGTSLKKGETVYLEVWTTYQEWAKDPAGHAPAGYLMGTLVRGENPCFF